MIKQSRWLQSRGQRYLFIGVSVYLFELLIILVAQLLGAGSLLAVGLSFWLGLLVSFGLQKMITFEDKRLQKRVVAGQFGAFMVLVLFNFGFTLLVTHLLSNTIPAVFCRTLALAITTIWNFYLYKTRIFAGLPATVTSASPPTLRKQLLRQQKYLVKRYKQWRKQPALKRWRGINNRPRFGQWYLAIALLILLATTIMWSLLGATVQQSNADQLTNAYLFQNWHTFQGAAFPAQHSFFIKWPLFFGIKLLGFRPASFIAITILTVLVTLALFIYVMWRTERRPLVLGTLFLILASVLLMVPAQPYSGGLLPVNMAMLATRNLEYVLFIAGLCYLIKAPGLRSRRFLIAISLLAVLVVSDKFFLLISLGGAVLGLLLYALRQAWKLASLSAQWLSAAIMAALGAIFLGAVINHAHIAHLVGQTTTGPYGLVQTPKDFVLGVFYAATGIFTNFGANPAYDARTIRQIPHSLSNHLLAPGGPALVINSLFLLGGLTVASLFLLKTLKLTGQKKVEPAVPVKLSSLLLLASVAAAVLFVLTDHYYLVDARYLTLWLFTLFTVAATWLRSRRFDPELLVLALPLLIVSISAGIISNVQTFHSQKTALSVMDRRDKLVAQTVARHRVDVLVGDYWRVIPAKSLSRGRQNVLPLSGCTQARTVLTSLAWQPNLHRHSFAYLLSLDGSLTDYPNCTLQQVTEAYGLPNSSALIDGSLARPKELLLFYDSGIRAIPKTAAGPQTPATILPIALSDVPHTSCPVPTIMNIVAHEDDDLLFMNPDLLQNIKAGHCVRSVYLTAGDAGADQPYWLGREQGSEAAYSEMMGTKTIWIHQIVQLPSGQYVTIATPKGNDKISLIFLHLPDGGVAGDGYSASHNESLAKLEAGQVPRLQSVDHQSSYDIKQLSAGLVALLHTYQPAEVRTQSNYGGSDYPDHSDHLASGRIATQAFKTYEDQQYAGYVVVPLSYYVGYPIHQYDANVDGQNLAEKEAAFSAYASFDGGVCHSQEQCYHGSVYGVYLSRQYKSPY